MAVKKIKKKIAKKIVIDEPVIGEPAELESPQEEIQDQEETDEQIINIAKERYKIGKDAVSIGREAALNDLEFLSGNQWPEAIKRQREEDERPCLVVNRMPIQVAQICNDQRQSRPSIKISPVDSKADIETAKVMQGLCKHIERDSNAAVAYDDAFHGAVSKGFGHFRIATEYCNPLSFDQDIKIKKIPNHFSVTLDPYSVQPDGSDIEWAFIEEKMSPDEFKSQFPKAKNSNVNEWAADNAGWFEPESARVVEYFRKVYRKTEILLLKDNSVIERKDLPEGAEKLVKDSRESEISSVKWVKMCGDEILERGDWPGQWIPIITVYGNQLDIDGKKINEGIIRHAKDPAIMANVFSSAEAEAIGLAPKAPFIGVEGQFEGHESQWESANVKNHAYLEYRSVDLNGKPAPPPQRNSYEPPVLAITGAKRQAIEDIKATTGLYDPSIGKDSQEKSGIAIKRSIQQAQTSNFHFSDNFNYSFLFCWRQVVDLIPKAYDSARAIRVLGEDGTEEIVQINKMFEKNGKQITYDFAGKYDVALEAGPNYATKRQEAAADMLELLKFLPPDKAVLVLDLMVANFDWPGAKEIAERFRKNLPQGVIEEKDAPSIPQQTQQQIQEMNQLIEQLTAALKEKTAQADTKKMELESKERIEAMKLQHDLTIQTMKINHAATETLFAAETEKLNQRLSYLEMDQPINADNEEQNLNQNFNESGNQAAIQTNGEM